MFEKRRCEGVLQSLGHTVLTIAVARRDDGGPAVAQSGVDVVEVEIHVAVAGDQLRDRAGGGGQGVVGFAESVDEVQIAVDLRQSLIIDKQQCVDIFGHLVGSLEGLVDLLLAFEVKRYGDDAYREQTPFAGHAGHNRAGTGAGASTHARGDEHHAGVVLKQCLDLGYVVFSSLAGHFRPVAGSKAVADHHFGRHRTLAQCLSVGVQNHERHMLDALTEHVVDGIAAAAANAYGLDDYFVFLFVLGRFELIGESFGIKYFVHFSCASLSKVSHQADRLRRDLPAAPVSVVSAS